MASESRGGCIRMRARLWVCGIHRKSLVCWLTAHSSAGEVEADPWNLVASQPRQISEPQVH